MCNARAHRRFYVCISAPILTKTISHLSERIETTEDIGTSTLSRDFAINNKFLFS